MLRLVTKSRLAISVSTLTLAIGGVSNPASSAVCNWAGGSGSWTNSLLWSCGAQPGSGDNAVITTAGSIVSVSGISAVAANISLSGGNQLNLTGSDMHLSANGTVADDGVISVAANSNFINNGGTLAFSGTGSVHLDDSGGLARIYGSAVTFANGFTVDGSGQLGINQTIFNNAGLISADVNGRTLDIDPSGGNGGVGAGNGFGTNTSSAFLNTGTLQATGGGALALEGGLYENSGVGVIQALNGSAVNLNADSRILNGTLTSVGTGVINAHGTTQYLNNVTLSSGSHLDVNNDNFYVNTSLVNNGLVTVGNNGSLINEAGALSITGSGTIRLDNSAGIARIYGGTISFGSNQSLTGSGQLGINQTIVTNNNLFSVGNGSTLDIDVSGGNGGVGAGNGVGTNLNSGLLNNGVIEANSGSTISLEGGLYENAAGGIMRALNGSTLNLNGDARVLNGTLTSDGTSIINAHGTTQYLNNVTLSSGTHLDVNNDALFLNTAFANNGLVTVSHNGSLINESGLLTISGSGTIQLDNSAGVARIYGNQIVFGSNQSVTGSGQLGINQTIVTNNNLFSVGNGGTLDIDVSGGNGGVGANNGVGTNHASGLLNNGVIEANNGSTISLEGGLYENAAGGVMRALNGSTINLNGDARVLNGTLSSDGTSIINAHGTTQYLSSVTLSSGTRIDVNNDSLFLNASLVNNGQFKLSNAASLIAETGTVSITGTGSLLLDDTNNVARIYAGNITFGSGQTVSGSGQVGLNQTIVTNNGLFDANVAGRSISIDAAGGNGGVGVSNGVGTSSNSGFLNNNILQASNGGTLSIEGGLYENAPGGVIQALNGSTVSLNGDSRILNGTLTTVGSGVINAHGTNQYLTNVTLSAGSHLDVNNDSLYLNASLVNNGLVTVGNGGSLINETGTLNLNGTGAIQLNDTANVARIYSGTVTIGPNLTVNGSGQIGLNQTIITNNGLIDANVTGRTLDIDVAGGNGGVGVGNGVGTNTASGLLNNGVLSASNGGTLALEGGLYENGGVGLGGTLFAGSGGTLVFNGDANFFNLKSGGVLDAGKLRIEGFTATSVINLRSTGASSIATIGTPGGSTTEVQLQGANSALEVTPFGGGTPVTIDQTLTGVASSGVFALDGRNFTVTAGGGNFSNAGLNFVRNSVFTANSYNNSGTIYGDGTSSLATPLTNSGSVIANTGTLTTQAITGPSGTVTVNPGATLNIGGTSTAGLLNNNGTLGLGTNSITVTSDYTNANFGSGNAFSGHANVTGSGLILAANATMDLSGSNLSGTTLNVGSVRTGGSSSTMLTVTNNGTLTTLHGAVQNSNAPSVNLTGANWTIGPNGGSTNVTISYTGLTAGSLAGQTLNVVNNFDNVARKVINLTGTVYQAAQPGTVPTSITLGARRIGDASATSAFSISNAAPVSQGFNEQLGVSATTGSGFLINGSSTLNLPGVNAGSSAPVIVSHGTGTAGAFSDTITIANTSLAVANSGLSNLALANQSVAVSGNVYAQAVDGLSTNTINFGTVRQGTLGINQSVLVTNNGTGALVDSLVTGVGPTPSGVSATAPGALAAGHSGNLAFALDTTTARNVSGPATVNFTSHDNELTDVSAGSQTINFTGTITELASASLFKNSGAGTLSGGSSLYTFDLGTLNANSGVFSTDFGVLNGNSGQLFSELLSGRFTFGGGSGWSISGNNVLGLAGGLTDIGNFLRFDTTGLGNGSYSTFLTFNGVSQFSGLTDFALGPVNVNIRADISGSSTNGAVPEPSTWLTMLVGMLAVGTTLRRRHPQARVRFPELRTNDFALGAC